MRFFAARQSLLIALGLALALIGWMLSGQFNHDNVVSPGEQASDNTADAVPETSSDPIGVRVKTIEAQPVNQDVVVSGRTEPARAVELRAEVDGRVVAIMVERGAKVETGQVLIQLDDRDRRRDCSKPRPRCARPS